MAWAKLEVTSGGLKFTSSYDSGLVSSLKAQVPPAARRWDNDNKAWIIAPRYGQVVADICRAELGVNVVVPTGSNTRPRSEQRLIQVDYIGQLKDRGDGTLTAFGLVSPTNEWAVVFSEAVLRAWFEGDNKKESIVTTTLYSLLALKRNATQDEIKAAWRRMIKRYHPDVNRDDDAAAMTRAINDAYEVLRNPNMRKRYDAGLQLEASIQGTQPRTLFSAVGYWRPPIRCGNILATGHEEVGRFVVERIDEWLDITRNGMTLVTSWDTTTNSLTKEWI